MLATNIIPRHDGFRMCVLRDTRMSQMHRRNPQSAFATFRLIQLIYEMFYIHAKSSSKLRHQLLLLRTTRCQGSLVLSLPIIEKLAPSIWSPVPLAIRPNMGPRFRQDSKMPPHSFLFSSSMPLLPFLLCLALPATVFTQTTAFDALDCCAVKKVDGKMNTHFFYQFLHIVILALHIHRYGCSWRNLLFG